jgi:dienelactone hydrolase/pimeloyl-ACP methyl ester carboxylesterase
MNALGIALAAASLAAAQEAAPVSPKDTVALFNGKDLAGLTTWLRDTKREDPRQVFSVRDGVLHVSGDGFGYVATDKAYRDYRLVVEYKWGTRTDGGKYVRNSGILLHATGPDGGAGKGTWMSSIECQLAQGCVGDFIVIRGKDEKDPPVPVSITVDAAPGPDKRPRWKKGGTPTVSTGRQIWWNEHDPDFKELLDTRGKNDVESPLGEWTRVEVVAEGKRLQVFVNGKQVNEAYDVSPAAGKILLQTEGFEILFRKFEIHPLAKTGAAPEPRKMLQAYLLAEAQNLFDARRKEVAAIKTPEDLRRRQESLRAKFVEAIGGFPEKTPLNARVVGTLDRGDYRVEKVIYESRPDHHVTAALYLPRGSAPFPGVIMPMGHSSNGKAADYAQRGSILLAKNGIACLNYDPIGQGERMQILGTGGKPLIQGTTEHTMVGIGALLVGRSTASYRIWDGIRSLDYLASRPEIDPKRLGCTGCSGGGTLTSYLMALDDRILAAAPSCYITTLERLFATIGPQDAEQNITGQVAFGMEHPDYITMRAPKPTLLATATQDFFDIQGSWNAFREAKLAYGLLGHGERVELVEYDTKHGYPRPQRESIVRFMRRWLLGVDDAIVEPDFPIEKDADLQCTETGQVLSSLKGRSVIDLNVEEERALASRRPRLDAATLAKEVRRLVALPAELPGPKLEPAAPGRADYESEPGIKVPTLSSVTLDTESRRLTFHVEGEGASEARVGKLIAGGRWVLAPDLRGFGRTAPAAIPARGPGPFGVDFKEAFLAIHLGRPLLGQRVFDLLAGKGDGEARLVGVGAAAPVALHAAFLDPGFTEVVLERGLVSWAAVVRAPVSVNQLTNVVPGALKVYDLPDLAAALAPRPLTIRGAVDPQGKPLTQAQMEEAYAGVREAYRKAGAERNLILEAAP